MRMPQCSVWSSSGHGGTCVQVKVPEKNHTFWSYYWATRDYCSGPSKWLSFHCLIHTWYLFELFIVHLICEVCLISVLVVMIIWRWRCLIVVSWRRLFLFDGFPEDTTKLNKQDETQYPWIFPWISRLLKTSIRNLFDVPTHWRQLSSTNEYDRNNIWLNRIMWYKSGGKITSNLTLRFNKSIYSIFKKFHPSYILFSCVRVKIFYILYDL